MGKHKSVTQKGYKREISPVRKKEKKITIEK